MAREVGNFVTAAASARPSTVVMDSKLLKYEDLSGSLKGFWSSHEHRQQDHKKAFGVDVSCSNLRAACKVSGYEMFANTHEHACHAMRSAATLSQRFLVEPFEDVWPTLCLHISIVLRRILTASFPELRMGHAEIHKSHEHELLSISQTTRPQGHASFIRSLVAALL